ncbi:uncharacterized protein [Magallana gigas]|uniref:uncharacterized protein n=1 Tax=Magallana gigas TaxID=29159 RepID=UPI003341FCE0
MISVWWLLRSLFLHTGMSQLRAVTWFEAQTICRENKQSLTVWKNESTNFYWTGFYKKTSHWIKIIDCYNATEIQYGNVDFVELRDSSPQLCQEHCLRKNISLFAVQARKCICLSDGFDYSKGKLDPSNCSYMCSDTTLLSTECGGETGFNVFLTDTTILNIDGRCLTIQCVADPKFTDYSCNDFLSSICSNLVDVSNVYSWTNTKDYCKITGTYPIGNLTLSNVKMACIESNLSNASPRWIGVVKELHNTQDQGQLITYPDQKFITSCMKCRVNYTTQEPQCQYEFCNDNSISEVYCSKNNSVGKYTDTTSEISSRLVTTSGLPMDLKARSTEILLIQVVVPVVLVLLFLSGLMFAVVLYIRSKLSKEKDSEVDTNPSTNDSRIYSNVQPQNSNNYCELQQPYSTSGSTDYSQLQFDSQPNYGFSNHFENGAEQSKTSDYMNIN